MSIDFDMTDVVEVLRDDERVRARGFDEDPPVSLDEARGRLLRALTVRGTCTCYERPRRAGDHLCAEHGWIPPGVQLARFVNTGPLFSREGK